MLESLRRTSPTIFFASNNFTFRLDFRSWTNSHSSYQFTHRIYLLNYAVGFVYFVHVTNPRKTAAASKKRPSWRHFHLESYGRERWTSPTSVTLRLNNAKPLKRGTRNQSTVQSRGFLVDFANSLSSPIPTRQTHRSNRVSLAFGKFRQTVDLPR